MRLQEVMAKEPEVGEALWMRPYNGFKEVACKKWARSRCTVNAFGREGKQCCRHTVLQIKEVDAGMGDVESERRCCGCSHRIYHHGRV